MARLMPEVVAVAEWVGKHRKGRTAAALVPRRTFEPERRDEAWAITAACGGWAWVMWGPWSRAFVAFGRWGYPPVAGRDRTEVERAIHEAYVQLCQGADDGRGGPHGGGAATPPTPGG